ncbi:caspase family protein [Prosthecodimorpha staleyi]|uniref:Caspase family protein n=1 Tax=Prosthecodimorpha staleyi TaxID=2840188 RepID=A0A947D4J1_9HYPH|nr:caspase family protein [Prosthecodimorpha staleyi]MBT9289436.1 caspase family protein [Prosthecodimorpha staleyi]
MSRRLTAIAALLFCLSSGLAEAAGRVALLIGNGAYPVGALANTGRDVAAMRAAFEKAGFDSVQVETDLDRHGLLRALDAFEARARGAEIAVVFYSGHGVELGGSNYLVPTDARLATDRDVKYEAVALDDVLAATEGASRLKLVILDACRDNPFVATMQRAGTRGRLGRGLARAEAPLSNMLIAYATAPGQVAADGTGANSPFTEALVRHIVTPGLDVRIALGLVRDDVVAATRQTGEPQIPYQTGSVGGALVALAPATETAPPPTTADRPPVTEDRPPVTDPESAMRADFDRTRAVGTAAAWDIFLKRHPSGFYADLARAERAKLARPDAAGSPKPQTANDRPKPAAKPVAATRPAAPKTSTRGTGSPEAGSRPDPLSYSKVLWPPFSQVPGQTLSAQTRYGRLTCIPNPGGMGPRRHCRWFD